jgi:hypothetical protein
LSPEKGLAGEAVMDLVALTTSAVAAAAAHFGEKAADGAATNVGAKVVDWLKKRFAGTSDMAALEKLAESPESVGARRMMEGAILYRLEQDGVLVQSLASLLHKTLETPTLRQTVVGDGNSPTMIYGNHNKVSKS